ncbi:MAG: single-stranded DNA-binding protein [Rhodospirillales bacterium]|nr:single-stranded DNA-binding protein [Rhodospirillales bacterium]MDE2391536.1 single-stranded DNA-binding protein [Rhodospirillales bacterium]MDE2457855.1 single-stranded DNA-binding protein [Rhodospirillales bacterium]
MAGSVNKVTIVGNLGRDPEIRNTQSGMKIANLAVATSETWNDKASGERKEQTEWHRVVIMNDRLGEVAEKYLRKGSKVYLEGKLQTRKWTDQSGQERYTTEIVIGRFNGELVLLDRVGGTSSGGEDYAPRAAPSAPAGKPAARAVGGWDARPSNDLDDEIPF